MNGLWSAETCEHGTPAEGVALAVSALRGVDLDPTSSAYWNHYTVRAARYFDREANGLRQAWSGRVFVNPPGADKQAGTASLVRPCWDKLVGHHRAGDLEGAVWWGYSLEQLQLLQKRSATSPLRFLTVVLAGRPRHMVRTGDGPPTVGASPTHGGFCSLLPSLLPSVAEGQIARFLDHGSKLGVVVRPARLR